jgi:hypothetical protein
VNTKATKEYKDFTKGIGPKEEKNGAKREKNKRG